MEEMKGASKKGHVTLHYHTMFHCTTIYTGFIPYTHIYGAKKKFVISEKYKSEVPFLPAAFALSKVLCS